MGFFYKRCVFKFENVRIYVSVCTSIMGVVMFFHVQTMGPLILVSISMSLFHLVQSVPHVSRPMSDVINIDVNI